MCNRVQKHVFLSMLVRLQRVLTGSSSSEELILIALLFGERGMIEYLSYKFALLLFAVVRRQSIAYIQKLHGWIALIFLFNMPTS